jgi:hypothetical protein
MPVLGSPAMGVQRVADPQQSLSTRQNPPTPRQVQVPRGREADDATHWPPKQSAVVRLHPLSRAWALQVPSPAAPEQQPGLNTSVRATDPAGRHRHAPATQVPRAQSASVVQGPPSPERRHCPETHAPLQQSEDDRHAGPMSSWSAFPHPQTPPAGHAPATHSPSKQALHSLVNAQGVPGSLMHVPPTQTAPSVQSESHPHRSPVLEHAPSMHSSLPQSAGLAQQALAVPWHLPSSIT